MIPDPHPGSLIVQVPFRSDSRHVPWLEAGRLSADITAERDAVAVLVNPAGTSARPVRLLLGFEDALTLAHQLMAASSRLQHGDEPSCVSVRRAR